MCAYFKFWLIFHFHCNNHIYLRIQLNVSELRADIETHTHTYTERERKLDAKALFKSEKLLSLYYCVYRSVAEEFNVNDFIILFGYEFIQLISPFIYIFFALLFLSFTRYLNSNVHSNVFHFVNDNDILILHCRKERWKEGIEREIKRSEKLQFE